MGKSPGYPLDRLGGTRSLSGYGEVENPALPEIEPGFFRLSYPDSYNSYV
jgi:hypothetical protein